MSFNIETQIVENFIPELKVVRGVGGGGRFLHHHQRQRSCHQEDDMFLIVVVHDLLID